MQGDYLVKRHPHGLEPESKLGLVLYSDSPTAIRLSRSGEVNLGCKHFDITHYFVRDAVAQRKLH